MFRELPLWLVKIVKFTIVDLPNILILHLFLKNSGKRYVNGLAHGQTNI